MTGMDEHIDMQGGIRQAGGRPDLYLRFLRRFPDDPSMNALGQALGNGDMSRAFLCAHTLKGLTAQLAITALSSPVCALCELLRPQNPAALEEARVLYAALLPLYRQVVSLIEAM